MPSSPRLALELLRWLVRLAALLAATVATGIPSAGTTAAFTYDEVRLAVDVESGRDVSEGELPSVTETAPRAADLRGESAEGAGTTPGLFFAAPSSAGGLLSEAAPGVYRSPGGLTYGPGSVQGHRTTHVLEHARPNPGKPNHSVFATSSDNLPGIADEVFGVIDEAWAARGAPLLNDPGVFVVPMGRTVGTAGETSVRIVVRPGTSEIITAYPT